MIKIDPVSQRLISTAPVSISKPAPRYVSPSSTLSSAAVIKKPTPSIWEQIAALWSWLFSRQAVDKVSARYWGLGKENKWRELIDGRYHHLGKLAFDKGLHKGIVEPGYIGSLERACDFLGGKLRAKLDANLYLETHKIAASHFDGKRTGNEMGQEKVGVFRDSSDYISAYYVDAHKPTDAACEELVAFDREVKQRFGESFGIGFYSASSVYGGRKLTHKAMSQDQVRQVFSWLTDNLHRELARSWRADARLTAIAKFHQRLEWLHAVKDGSSRMNMLFLNKHLSEWGFHPVILNHPIILAALSVSELKAYLRQGMASWEEKRPSQ
ncbi:MAG: Fic family protein [Verrucomicrobia bacterium]|nr:Fic family protein [Verrucomicrobiota bacterium]